MTIAIAPDLGAWLVLRRVQWNRVVLDATNETLYDQGHRLSEFLTPHMHELANGGYVLLGEPLPEPPRCQRVRITQAGECLLDLLYDQWRHWIAQHRAGLPRCRADLNTLTRVLDGLRRLRLDHGQQ
jgi:hypothetical protein